MKYIIRLGSIFVVSLVISSSILGHVNADTFNPNHIIDDAVFDNTATMTASDIDAWLNNTYGNSSCISTDHGFSAPDPTGYSPSTGFTYGGNVSAGQVIYDAALAYDLNPQVLIVTLEKEQSLVSGAAGCSTVTYTGATGYGCLDGGADYNYSGIDLYTLNGTTVTAVNGTCVDAASKAGFSQQIIHAAWLLKFGEQRSEGNIGFDIQATNYPEPGDSWDNSDDPQTCYSGPMIMGDWQICPDGPVTYYDGYTTIDGSAVQMDDASTASLYYYTPHFPGNENFFNLFTSWFGSTTLPVAFQVSGSPDIYLQVDSYKYYVPTITMLEDFGVQPGQVQTISAAAASIILAPPSGSNLSTGLGNLVKSPSDTDADGASVYLVTYGKRYDVSTQQLTDFDFSTSNIAYLPLSFIYSIPNGGALSNYVQALNYNVFDASGGQKHIIFNNATYLSLNPGGSLTPVSEPILDAIPSGLPISSSAILVGTQEGSIYLFLNNDYYYVPSTNEMTCWGLMSSLALPLNILSNDNYVASITSSASLGCINSDGTNTYLLNGSNKIIAPGSYGLSPTTLDQNLIGLENALPTRSNQLGQVVEATNSPIVWYIENGIKKGIPSLFDLQLLGYNGSQIDWISPAAVNALPGTGLKLGLGQVVKDGGGATVYVITSPTTKTPIATPDDFEAYNYSWTTIESFPQVVLDQYYATTNTVLSKYLYTASGANYLMDPNGCYGLIPSELTAFGQPLTATQAGQTYSSSIFPYVNLVKCMNGSIYAKSVDQSTVYWINGGIKYPISTWGKLQSMSGQSNPYIIALSDSTLAQLPTGATQ